MSLARFARCVALAIALQVPVADAGARSSPRVERVVMLMRHGVRAPIDGEVPADTRTGAPWPRWPVAAEMMTPHGLAALEGRGADDRAWLAAAGVFDPTGCPVSGSVRIHSNVSQRTIDSAAAFAHGFAPGCPLAAEHQRAGTIDPLFEPLRVAGTGFDPAAAVASIEAYTGGVNRLTRRHRAALDLLDRVLACPARTGCTPRDTASVRVSADGRGVELTGPIRRSSGIAQVLLLEYAQGMPRAAVGRGRADPAALKRLGALHAALFDVFTRSPYMTAYQAGPIGRAMLASLDAAEGPRLDLFVGHDTNVTALAAALGVPLVARDYATGDVPPGGALALALLRDPGTGARFVRVTYRVQPLAALRDLRRGVASTTITVPGCAALCPLDRFARSLTARLTLPATVAKGQPS